MGSNFKINLIIPVIVYRGVETIGSILNPLVGKFSEDTRKNGKGAKPGHLTIGGAFICRNMIG